MESILQLHQKTIPKEKLAEFENEIKESISITVNTADITVKELESEGIYGTINIYSNYHTMLNVVAQCFRAIHFMTKCISDNVRRKQLQKGFELARIPSAVSKSMSQEEQRKMHITASQKERGTYMALQSTAHQVCLFGYIYVLCLVVLLSMWTV